MAVRSVLRKLSTTDTGFLAVYSVLLLLFFHLFAVQYINSSFLGQFLPRDGVSPVFVIAASFTVFAFLFISRVLRQVGNYHLTLLLLVLNIASVSGMAFANSLATALPFFVLHLISLPLILFNVDVFMESYIGNHEHTTGSKRGLVLALVSFIGAIAPLLTGFVVDTGGFSLAYLVSLVPLIPVFVILVSHFRDFQDPAYREIRVMRALRSFWEKTNIRLVFLSHLLLRIFFSFMVIYAPFYLAFEIGLSWRDIGLIIFVGQLAYVLLEYPIGLVADNILGEREMMTAGFLILAATTPLLALLTTTAVAPWMAVMFLTRVGASFVEVTTESYFFKHTKGSDAQIISFFRLSRPLSIVAGASIGSLALIYLPFSHLFMILSALMLLGVVSAYALIDTR